MQADDDVATPILSTFILGTQINAGHSKNKKKKLTWARTYIYPQKSVITTYKEQSETMLNLSFCASPIVENLLPRKKNIFTWLPPPRSFSTLKY